MEQNCHMLHVISGSLHDIETPVGQVIAWVGQNIGCCASKA